MVHFNNNKFTIEVCTSTANPIEEWLETHDQLLSLLSDVDNDLRESNYYHVIELLRAMMPDWETAKRMT